MADKDEDNLINNTNDKKVIEIKFDSNNNIVDQTKIPVNQVLIKQGQRVLQ